MVVRPLVMPNDRRRIQRFLSANHSRGELSENKMARLDLDEGRRVLGVVGESDGDIAALSVLAPAASHGEWAMEVVTRPEPGDLAELVATTLDLVRGHGAERLRWWVYAGMDVPDPRTFGFRPERRLLLMGRTLPVDRAPAFPDSIRVAGFRPGADEEAWLAANNAAFAGHPENGSLTLEDLETRQALEWFDPEGIRMAWEGKELAGFCWTKVHPTGEGEIYIIGTVPGFQGRGLGRALVLEGMRYLEQRGCEKVILYTEGDNVPAVRLYESLGMETEAVHRSFIRPVNGV